MPGQEDNSTDPLVTASAGAYKLLRKLLAAGEKYQGNFYFVSDTRAQKAAIVVTLSNRDKDGQKALAAGRPLRKAVPGSKFARGRIRNINKRLWMEVVAGNAPASLLNKAFKKAFQEPELAQLKKLLKKAKMGNPETNPELVEAADADRKDAAEAAALAQEAIDALDEDERADVAALLTENNDLAAINQTLAQAFLSQDNADAEEAAEQTRVLAELRALSKDHPGDPRIQELRYGLTEMLYKNPNMMDNVFPEVGEPLSAGMVEVLQTQISNSVDQLLAQLTTLAGELAAANAAASSRSGRDQSLYSQTALQTLQQHPQQMQVLLNQIHTMTR